MCLVSMLREPVACCSFPSLLFSSCCLSRLLSYVLRVSVSASLAVAVSVSVSVLYLYLFQFVYVYLHLFVFFICFGFVSATLLHVYV